MEKYVFELKPGECVAVNFMSRNKDNTQVENFKQRNKSFIFDGSLDVLRNRFNDFVEKGQPGELSRMYVSLNPRNKELVKKRLLIELIKDDNINICKLEPKLASLSMSSECKVTKYWLWDFDGNREQLSEFIKDVKDILPTVYLEVYKTVNGFAVVTSGFDSRTVVKKYKGIAENKKDAYILMDWKSQEE